MKNWDLFRSLCRMIAAAPGPGEARRFDTSHLPQLAQLAGSHDLLPALATRVQALDPPAGPLAPGLAGELGKALLQNTRRNMQITAQSLKLARQLNQVGIAPMFLKGTALLLTGEQRDIGFRKQVDIDVLVPVEAIEEACRALLADGYSFYLPETAPGGKPGLLHDAATAAHLSRAHHHLPPMVKDGYSALVEVHRHHLPRRFQRHNPPGQVFDSACAQRAHGSDFLVPAWEHQLIQLILGNFLHDGYEPRYEFPIRSGHDYLQLLDLATAEGKELDTTLLQERCGGALAVFSSLVTELMKATPTQGICPPADIRGRLWLMKSRMNSPWLGQWLDSQARLRHLGRSLWHNSGKLPGYLKRAATQAPPAGCH